jgi:hypothetical protein
MRRMPTLFCTPYRRHLLGVGVLQPSAAELRALIAGPRDPGEHALADHGAFELGKDAHHLEHRPARRCGGIKALLMQEKIDALCVKLAKEVEQID